MAYWFALRGNLAVERKGDATYLLGALDEAIGEIIVGVHEDEKGVFLRFDNGRMVSKTFAEEVLKLLDKFGDYVLEPTRIQVTEDDDHYDIWLARTPGELELAINEYKLEMLTRAIKDLPTAYMQQLVRRFYVLTENDTTFAMHISIQKMHLKNDEETKRLIEDLKASLSQVSQFSTDINGDLFILCISGYVWCSQVKMQEIQEKMVNFTPQLLKPAKLYTEVEGHHETAWIGDSDQIQAMLTEQAISEARETLRLLTPEQRRKLLDEFK